MGPAAWGLLGLAAALLACGAEAPSRPDLVVITLDTFRWDRLGALGGTAGLTPNLDALAAESVLFERAVTPIGSTVPAHASLFTGLHPGRHGVRWNGASLESRHETVAERLRDAGYTTAAFVGLHSLLRRAGLAQGFEVTSDAAVGEPARALTRPAHHVNELARDWLATEPERPLFLWLHYFDAHAPYGLTRYARERLEGYEGPFAEGASVPTFYSFRAGAGRELGREDRAALDALYDGAVRGLDQRVGEMLAFLARRGFLDHAVVVVAADHGQLLGEHGDVGHGSRLWQPVLQVPLLIWRSVDRRPARVSTRVSLLDVGPTLLELAGVPAPPAEGRSLVAALEGTALEERPAFASVTLQEGAPPAPDPAEWDRDVTVFSERYKLILADDGSEAFYDVVADPAERAPLGGEAIPDDVARELRVLAAGHRVREREELGMPEVADEVIEELQALGYVH